MTGVLVHCEHCGYSGAVGLFNLPPDFSLQATFSDSTVTCPRCGRDARILDGTFEYRDEMIRVLSAPNWSLARLRALREAVQWAQQRLPDDAGTAITRVSEVDREVGGLLLQGLARGWSRADMLALLSLLATVIFGVIALIPHGAQEVRIDPEQIRKIVDQQAPASSPGDSPPATPSTPAPQTRASPNPPPPPRVTP